MFPLTVVQLFSVAGESGIGVVYVIISSSVVQPSVVDSVVVDVVTADIETTSSVIGAVFTTLSLVVLIGNDVVSVVEAVDVSTFSFVIGVAVVVSTVVTPLVILVEVGVVFSGFCVVIGAKGLVILSSVLFAVDVSEVFEEDDSIMTVLRGKLVELRAGDAEPVTITVELRFV